MEDVKNNMEFVRMFERRLAEYTGFRHAVCVDCCTNGILLSMELLRRLGVIGKEQVFDVPARTYMSVPMTLINNGWRIRLVDKDWVGDYSIGDTAVYDAATCLNGGISYRYPESGFVCISFQQKKRLSLGRGGAILLNDPEYASILRRMAYDGRDPFKSDRTEVDVSPGDIILGYHCYMDPEKAALGIARLNQLQAPP